MTRSPGKCVETADHQRPQRCVADHPQPQREALTLRQVEGAVVEDHQAFDPFRMPNRPPETDHPAPIMDDEVDVVEPEVVHETRKIIDATAQSVFVVKVTRLVRKPAADMIRHNDPVVVSKAAHKIAVIKRPGRIAVHGHYRFSATLVEVMEMKTVELQPVVFERVEVFRNGTHALFSDSRQRIATTAARPSCS